MYRLTLLCLMLIPLFIQAKDKRLWQKMCLTENGDTLRVGDSILLVPGMLPKTQEFVTPHFQYEDKKWFNYRDYISFMAGKTYAITRMSRMNPENSPDEYKPIIIITQYYSQTSPKVEYIILLDKALKAGVIEIKKQGG